MKYLTLAFGICFFINPALAISGGDSGLSQNDIPREYLVQCSKYVEERDTAIEIAIGKIFNRHFIDQNCVEDLRTRQSDVESDLTYYMNLASDEVFRNEQRRLRQNIDAFLPVSVSELTGSEFQIFDKKLDGVQNQRLDGYSVLSGSD